MTLLNGEEAERGSKVLRLLAAATSMIVAALVLASVRRLLPLAAIALVLSASAQGAAVQQRSRCAFKGAPAWSPNGKQIAWAGGRAICVAKANGSDAHPLHLQGQRLSAIPDEPGQLAWPRRNLLVYDDNYQLFVLRLHGVSSMLRDVSGARFSVDAAGTRIAIGCVEGGPPVPLTVIELANRQRTSIGGTTFNNCGPSLSPDGSRVAFKREASGEDGIWTAATDGTHLQKLVSSGDIPRWSPRRDRIAYITGRGQGLKVRLVSASGGASNVLVNQGAAFAWLDNNWSPDGRLFAFINTHARLSIVNTATHRVSTPRRPSGQISDIAWSPNGKQRLESRTTMNACRSLWRVPVKGGKPILISRHCRRH